MVAELTAPEDQRRRLQELGFVPGGRVEVVQESPWGDPVAYAVCGAAFTAGAAAIFLWARRFRRRSGGHR